MKEIPRLRLSDSLDCRRNFDRLSTHPHDACKQFELKKLKAYEDYVRRMHKKTNYQALLSFCRRVSSCNSSHTFYDRATENGRAFLLHALRSAEHLSTITFISWRGARARRALVSFTSIAWSVSSLHDVRVDQSAWPPWSSQRQNLNQILHPLLEAGTFKPIDWVLRDGPSLRLAVQVRCKRRSRAVFPCHIRVVYIVFCRLGRECLQMLTRDIQYLHPPTHLHFPSSHKHLVAQSHDSPTCLQRQCLQNCGSLHLFR